MFQRWDCINKLGISQNLDFVRCGFVPFLVWLSGCLSRGDLLLTLFNLFIRLLMARLSFFSLFTPISSTHGKSRSPYAGTTLMVTKLLAVFFRHSGSLLLLRSQVGVPLEPKLSTSSGLVHLYQQDGNDLVT